MSDAMNAADLDLIYAARPWLGYIAGPYRDERGEWFVIENIRKAAEIALECWKRGLAVICPHKNTAGFGGAAPDEVWLQGDLVMLLRCDVVICTPDWERSRGAQSEVAAARTRRLPVYVWGTSECEAFLAGLARGSQTRP